MKNKRMKIEAVNISKLIKYRTDQYTVTKKEKCVHFVIHIILALLCASLNMMFLFWIKYM